MIIFRSSGFASISLLLASCAEKPPAMAESCPEQALPYELAQFAADEAAAAKLASCLTEKAIGLSGAEGSNEEIATAAVASCDPPLGMFESQASIKAFEKGNLDMAVPTQTVRTEAERFALSRVVQARAGQCSGNKK